MPDMADGVDKLEAAFGPIKVRWCKEGEMEMGKQQPFGGTDADKYLRLVDMTAKQRGGGR